MDTPTKEKWWKNRWIVGSGTGVISALVIIILTAKSFLSTLAEIGTFLWKILTYPIQIQLQIQTGWVLLAILALVILGLFVRAKNKNLRRSLNVANQKLQKIEEEKIKIPPPPEHTVYVQDRFKLWTWKWKWMYNQQMKKWHVAQLTPYCPLCDIELMNKAGRYALAVCPKCGEKFGYVREQEAEDMDAVYLQIYDKVEKKTYKVNKQYPPKKYFQISHLFLKLF